MESTTSQIVLLLKLVYWVRVTIHQVDPQMIVLQLYSMSLGANLLNGSLPELMGQSDTGVFAAVAIAVVVAQKHALLCSCQQILLSHQPVIAVLARPSNCDLTCHTPSTCCDCNTQCIMLHDGIELAVAVFECRSSMRLCMLVPKQC